ncbi:MAG: hypothetical protein QOE70_2941 [Chthoniobacter sp.]|nr:hypothetical protein [Chthoniobacter sp.]
MSKFTRTTKNPTRTILITGAGSGFGRGLSLGLAREGHTILATSGSRPLGKPSRKSKPPADTRERTRLMLLRRSRSVIDAKVVGGKMAVGPPWNMIHNVFLSHQSAEKPAVEARALRLRPRRSAGLSRRGFFADFASWRGTVNALPEG